MIKLTYKFSDDPEPDSEVYETVEEVEERIKELRLLQNPRENHSLTSIKRTHMPGYCKECE